MAFRAVVTIIVLHMIRIVCIAVVIFMAGPAVGWCSAVSIAVAVYTLHPGVRSGQGELRVIVIESGRLPCSGAVANCAVVVKIVLHVIGIADAGEIRFVAGVTISRCSGIAVTVTIHTLNRRMSSGQRELGAVVIEGGGLPGSGTVANHAIMVKVVLHMAGITYAGEIGLVTRITVGRRTRISGTVTIDALNCEMSTGERELRCSMIERRRCPGEIRMANGAIMIKSIFHVVRILHRRKVGLVAAETIPG